MLSTSLLTVFALVPVVNIVCPAQPMPPLTRHVREVTLNGQARSIGRLPETQPMRLVLILPHRNQEALDDFLKELYDPSSPSYRKFLTVEEFTARFGPSEEDYEAVIRFAEDNGLKVVGTSRNRMNVDVTGPVATVEKAFHLTMGVYQHPTENRTFCAPDREPMLDLPFRLWHISGLDNYSIGRAAVRSPQGVQPAATTGSGPSGSFLGSDMRAAYYGGTALTGSGQSLGLLEKWGTNLSDLNTYYKNVGQTNKVPITPLSTDGASTICLKSEGCPTDQEQTLDMTQALGMAPGLSSLVIYIGNINVAGTAMVDDAAILNAMATASPLNAQLSSSWVWSPSDFTTDDPYFEEFAAQGQNFFQAAGDNGKYTFSEDVYPADNRYVTVVGGTDLTTSGPGGAWTSETAWIDGGGGPSPDGIPIPSWQRLAGVVTSANQGSTALRNSPDVAAEANFDFYVCANQEKTCSTNKGGTSFAAPMWAGYLALVNQQAVANDNSRLGFINPTIYTLGLGSGYATAFHDITSGGNGYPAVTGYDLATGWGSPNGTGLINTLAGTSPYFTISALPTSVSVVPGSNGASTITITASGGFDSPIALSATGQPTGVTIMFSSAPITGAGPSTMRMTVASSTVAGTYSITVTGTSGSTTETTTVFLTVQTFTTLLSFNGTDGSNPVAGLVQATNGDLYGTTELGGAYSEGTVFKITPSGTLTTLYSFCSQSGCTDGELPEAGLVQATNGDLYGTAEAGGAHSGGTVFRITPGGKLTTLYSFCSQSGCTDGGYPEAGLVQATNGDLYGTTYGGGARGYGTVFKITPSGTLTTLYSFCSQSGCTDGAAPHAGLVQATNGDLYGTTFAGGANCSYPCGTVFKITPGGTLTTLYSFCSQAGCTDGEDPEAGLVQAANGDLYGTTSAGGAHSGGAVFKITPSGTLTTLYSFCSRSGCTDGAVPEGGLVQATNGDLYGTTYAGGAGSYGSGFGTVFKITPSGTLTTFYSFCSQSGCTDGELPEAGLVQATNGDLYGTAYVGGAYNNGTVFSLSVGLGPFVETLPTSASAGAAVEILGTNLTAATSVSFNGIAAVFEVVSGSEITTTVPTGATTGTVQVVTPNGTLSSNVPFRVP
jgi:uncharacterized repeat protein (TIGR03803 family)